MGACGGKLDEETLRSRQIEKEMLKAKNQDEGKIKILLLGAGESGKSTLFKQFKILYSDQKDFSKEDRDAFVSVIHANIVSDMKIMIDACPSHTPIKNEDAANVVGGWGKNQKLGPDQLHVIEALWNDAGMVQTWQDRGDIQVQDALAYYMSDIARVCGVPSTFVPTNEDILHSRVRTSGVVQENFQIGEARFEMYDVGGQRNERRKWIHSFQNVTTVMFVAAVSEYNQVLYEDNGVNRQTEAVELFRQQLESEWFLTIPFILFLNKKDLFREKLPKIPFKVTEGDEQRNIDFQGPECEMDRSPPYNTDGSDSSFENCYDAALEYLKDIYVSQQDDLPVARKAGIYTHFTNSTDSENVERIMNSCKDIILRIQLSKFGWVHNN
mmetsp:Transcript_15441/g.19115  ORF Transcript_15441/g.19115 Transcript_15441/m.19115 type:complete len:383 (+) Transcript_15441:299-1447(+)